MVRSGRYILSGKRNEVFPRMIPQNNRSKLVIAIRETDMPLAHTILGDEYELVFSHTLETAQAAVAKGIEAVVCGVHFSQGAVFELLQFVRSSSTVGQVPFFVLLDSKGRYAYSPAIVHGLRAAAKALGATQFTDLGGLAEKVGNMEAVEVLRRGLRDAITCTSN
ncbi:hypothetical protein D3871_29085 [Noviherbaspirillum saxi]|uniref:Uncharacterized protein n=2 Tax=Noviherbaspirillum saxi TaxID=2320863 RepID=A0A3A3FJS1_9BURK|nr:hypothetical protein D3871_29085 [Noviherbaspirillum saxi]